MTNDLSGEIRIGIIKKLFGNDYFLLVILWLIATVLNINKAFHIDDTFHLEAAQWIAHDPLHPMSGMVNWTDVPEKISSFNQPPLYFYLIAFWSKLFGYHEVPLHLLQSVFTFLSLFLFFKISAIIIPARKKMLTTVFALGPAFLVNQNLMIDVPLLSVELLVMYLLISPVIRHDPVRYALAALFLGLGLLMKYSLMPLILVLIVSIVIQRKYKNLVFVLIPVLMLGMWSLMNYFEYGSLHISDRPVHSFGIIDKLDSGLSFMACLGAMTPFSILLIGRWVKDSHSQVCCILIFLAAFFVFTLLTYYGVVDRFDENMSKEILRYLNLLNGIFIVIMIIVESYSRSRWKPFQGAGNNTILMFFWFVSLSGFIILYAPFIATRHILLVLPALLFFLAPIIEKATVRIQLLTVLVTGFLGLTLGVSDWITANYYRKVSQELHITGTDTTRIWTAGHWGWQWYAGLNGMNQYDTLTSKVREGDLLIFPANIPRQKIDDDIVLKEVWKTWDKPSVFTYFSTGPKGGFYFSSYKRPGWRLLNEPVDTILVYRITGSKSDD